jgi:hypothetical protein
MCNLLLHPTHPYVYPVRAPLFYGQVAAAAAIAVALRVQIHCAAEKFAAAPAVDMDESYRVTVNSTDGLVIVEAAEVVGVLRALVTVAQLSCHFRFSFLTLENFSHMLLQPHVYHFQR